MPEHDINIGFKRRPPKKRHPFLDIMALCFAAALLTTVLNPYSSNTFAALSAIFIILYIGGWKAQDKKEGA